jgi:ATP-dependent Clp protease ATP-binding subunit ClpC
MVMPTEPFDTSGFRSGPFDELISRFFGADPLGGMRRPVQRVDLARLLSEQAGELIERAVGQAMEWGSPDVEVEHLLWAAAQLPAGRRILTQLGGRCGRGRRCDAAGRGTERGIRQ